MDASCVGLGMHRVEAVDWPGRWLPGDLGCLDHSQSTSPVQQLCWDYAIKPPTTSHSAMWSLQQCLSASFRSQCASQQPCPPPPTPKNGSFDASLAAAVLCHWAYCVTSPLLPSEAPANAHGLGPDAIAKGRLVEGQLAGKDVIAADRGSAVAAQVEFFFGAEPQVTLCLMPPHGT